jgi:hypothetical protein
MTSKHDTTIETVVMFNSGSWKIPSPPSGRRFRGLMGQQLSNWWYTYPSEKYESQLGWLFPLYYGKIKNVPNHQPDYAWPANLGDASWPSKNIFGPLNKWQEFTWIHLKIHLWTSGKPWVVILGSSKQIGDARRLDPQTGKAFGIAVLLIIFLLVLSLIGSKTYFPHWRWVKTLWCHIFFGMNIHCQQIWCEHRRTESVSLNFKSQEISPSFPMR